MSNEEQIAAVRAAYYEKRKIFYSRKFRMMLTAVIEYDKSGVYNHELEIIQGIAMIIENSLLRGFVSRSVKYLAAFTIRTDRLVRDVENDCMNRFKGKLP